MHATFYSNILQHCTKRTHTLLHAYIYMDTLGQHVARCWMVPVKLELKMVKSYSDDVSYFLFFENSKSGQLSGSYLEHFPDLDAESFIIGGIWQEIKGRLSINRANNRSFRSRRNNRGNYWRVQHLQAQTIIPTLHRYM